ncbi:MAG: stalk domain-containing protein [Armatimonadota bacterium]
MNVFTKYLQIAALMTLTAGIYASPIVVPKGTVIPVTLDTQLSSATNKQGDIFYAYHEGINGAGFPEYSNFTGKIKTVTKASGSKAGQIDARFTLVHLPDGSSIPIRGQLISMDKNNVKTDSKSGRLIGTANANNNPGKFIAIGAGAGLLAGQLGWKKPLIGTLIGAAAGYIYSTTQNKAAVGKDVVVKTGTPFGILLTKEVTIPELRSADAVSDTNTTTSTDDGLQVSFHSLQPIMSGNSLMVPFRSVMDSIDMPFSYNAASRTLSMSRSNSDQAVHTAVGTSLVYVDGVATRFDTPSRMVNGNVYVPASYIELITQKTAYWNHDTGILRLQ